MSKINILNEELINKIAAGEVIERPASIVKELVENSLDAGATKIVIEIKDSGKELIKVSDNGEGMDKEDAHNSFIRHATSKIKNTDDLFSINTLGFRGEALASIAAISQMSITTKQNNLLEGYNLAIEGGEIISSGIIAAEQGTTIEVRNIFFNTPVRKKFLKTDSVELRHIVEIILRYALINPHVSFKLTHEKHKLINSPKVNNWLNCISSIYGVKIAKDLLEVNYLNESENIKIKGYIVKPYQARNDKTQQNLFVNKRWIKNEGLNKTIYDAYHSLLFVNKHPVFILNIEVNPEKIDVNIHPTKQEIKFEQKRIVENALFTAIKETLQNNNLIPTMDLDTEQQLNFSITKNKKFPKYKFEKSEQKLLQETEQKFSINQNNDDENDDKNKSDIILKKNNSLNNYNNDDNNKDNYSNDSDESNSKNSFNLPKIRLLGQVHKTFFVAETIGGVLFIDQHVVQERVLYEKFMKQFLNKDVAIQTLLKNELLDLSVTESIHLLENKEYLTKLGFYLEEFGENSFVLKTIPTLFGRLQPKELLFNVLEDLKESKNKIEEIQEEIITRMACRASVKAGDNLTIPEMQKLLNELEKTNLPYTCPHGRSVLIKVNIDELEKKFKRK